MDLNAFEIFNNHATSAGVIFYQSGEFTSPIISAAAEALKLRLAENGASGPVTRKTFSTFVEMAQNIHHYAVPDAENSSGVGSIGVSKSGDDYWIVCANRVLSGHVSRITEKLELVRAMSLDEIKKAYKAQLNNENHANSDPLSRGAGLGWLTIARDSKLPIEYSFSSDEASNGQHAHFYVKAVI